MKNLLITLFAACAVLSANSCSDDYMEQMNTDGTKSPTIDPSTQLTTALLQTYGDFGLMDTYRNYITGFTQYYMGGWNVAAHAGSNWAKNDIMSQLWDRYYTIAIKNLTDAIERSHDKPNLNAALRIHKVYLLSVLTDTYGDVPCSEAGQGYLAGIATPKYDTQEEIYHYFFTELAECVAQLGTGNDHIGGDVTSLGGDPEAWKKYANSLRMRFAMRISDIEPAKAKEEFEKAMRAEGGYIRTAAEDAYVIHTTAPFTLYDGAKELDFRANALSEMLYGQDPTSPTFVCSTLYNRMEETGDPRLHRICRNYINTTRIETAPEGCFDVTDEVNAWKEQGGAGTQPNNPGEAWYHNWPTVPTNDDIPTLARLVKENPTAGYDQSNYPARMVRPFLAVAFEDSACPGVLLTSAETEFLLAEAAVKGWAENGNAQSHYEAGIGAALRFLNDHYALVDKISDREIASYIAANPLGDNPKEAINTQAWIHHLTNPAEGWANLRRSDYPVLLERQQFGYFDGFTYEDSNMTPPVRLKYPNLELKYNSTHYKEAIERLGGTDDWHKRNWWDTKEGNYYKKL
ncbi:SusD/RagB family nutrient-binding outer membrane lipoprotein [Alistipes sp.]|uniref:SusD/RagB family nutrient-binding outer membrane lipoprotein n=1 Tax=Alistipes sp. TaxID=1872444 RepID=UPI003A8612E5